MTDLRTEPFTKLPLSEEGERLSKTQLDLRVSRHLTNLHVDVPVLNYLWSSSVICEFEVAERRLWLIVSLRECKQPRLELVSQTKRTKTEDPFLDDVADVRRQVGNVKWRTLMALSATASPLDATQDNENAASTSSVRQRAKRGAKGGRLLLAGWPEPAQLDIDDLPAILPRVVDLEISAQVTWLNHETAELAKVRVIRSPESAPAMTIDEEKEFLLRRAGQFARPEHGTPLQIAMDKGKRVHLRVAAQLDWATAAVVAFELRDDAPAAGSSEHA